MIQFFWTSSNNRGTFNVIAWHVIWPFIQNQLFRKLPCIVTNFYQGFQTWWSSQEIMTLHYGYNYDTSLWLWHFPMIMTLPYSSVTLPGNQLGNTFGTFSKLNYYLRSVPLPCGVGSIWAFVVKILNILMNPFYNSSMDDNISYIMCCCKGSYKWILVKSLSTLYQVCWIWGASRISWLNSNFK